MDRYLLLDPTGANLVVYPEEPISNASGLVVSSAVNSRGRPITGSSEPRYDFQTTVQLSQADWFTLQAWVRQRETQGRLSETVVYWLWDLHVDLDSQTREAVPGLDPVVDGSQIRYYPVIQGDLSATAQLRGSDESGPVYAVGLRFVEGTIRRPTSGPA